MNRATLSRDGVRRRRTKPRKVVSHPWMCRMPLSPSDQGCADEVNALPAPTSVLPTAPAIVLRSCDLGSPIARGAGWLVAPWWPVGGALILLCRSDLSADERNEARDTAGLAVPHLRMLAVEHWPTVASWFAPTAVGDVPTAPHIAAVSPARPQPPASSPVTSWASVARTVGVSLDTLSRRRRAWGISDPRPYFVTGEEAKAWYRRGESGKLSRTTIAVAKPATRRPTPSSAGTAGTTLADLIVRGKVKPSRGGGSR